MSKSRSLFFYILYTILLFMYIYRFNLSVIGIPNQIHSRRISSIIIIIIGILNYFRNRDKFHFIRNNTCYAQFKKYCKICAFITLYALCLFIYIGKNGSGVHLVEYMLNICIFSIPVTFVLCNIFRDIDEFAKILIYVGILQSVIIIACLADASLANVIDITFNDTGESDYNAAHRFGYAGGIDCITATGVIKYSTALLATVYMYCKYKKPVFLFTFIFFSIINSMIARTGILFDAICFLFVLYGGLNRKVIANFLIPILLVGGVIYMIVENQNNKQFLNERYQRAITLREEKTNDKFFEQYLDGDYPPLSPETFMGVGMISGQSGNGYWVNIDGGPLRVYSSIGIIFSILFYISIFTILYKCIKVQIIKSDKLFMYLVAIIYLLGDIKEMTFLNTWPMSIYFIIAVLLEKKKVHMVFTTCSTK